MRVVLILLISVAGLRATDLRPVFAEFDRMAASGIWPGFDARKFPVAVYDGERTWLRHHPSPPATYHADGDLFVAPGQDSAIVANTAAELGGVLTATMIIEAHSTRTAVENAALLMHECFHVYQRESHPKWQGNEAVLFTYPIEDAESAALAALEINALRRASAGDAKCWASRFTAIRKKRFARLPAEAVEYERGTELNEGLAQYIQDRALGRRPSLERPFGPADVRNRAYVSGEGIALLLDQLRPGWKPEVVASLDELLPDGVSKCDFTDAERDAELAQARRAVAAVLTHRKESIKEFESAAGWRVQVIADGDPLRLGGFDPINVERLGGTKVLHTRFFKIANSHGSAEALNHRSVTGGVGPHPLFGGIREWTILVDSQPTVKSEGGSVDVNAPGLTLHFDDATVNVHDQRVIVHCR